MKYLLLSIIVISIYSCIKAPNFPDEPVITYNGLSRTTMSQGSALEDSVTIFFSFTDGDGDIGVPVDERDQDNFNVIIRDLRRGDTIDKLFAPYIPEKGATNGITGTGQVIFYTTCCIFPDGTPSCDTSSNYPVNDLVLEMTLKDRAGNYSNPITTDTIKLICDLN